VKKTVLRISVTRDLRRLKFRKIILGIVFIIALSLILGLAVNFSLLKKFIRGEFRPGFFSSENYPSIAFITLAEAEELFASQQAVFIDSRSEKDYRWGHVLGALNIPFEQNNEEEISNQLDLPPEKTLVVYCDGSECQSSLALAKVLDKLGFQSIKVFFGGWAEWVQAGLPVSAENDQQ